MKLGKFVIGLGLGAVAGLLLAPKKGSELREDIKTESLKAYNKVKDMSKEDVEAVLGQTIETVKKTVDEFDADEFKVSAADKLNDLQNKLEELATKVKESDQFSLIKESILEVSDKVNSKYEEVKSKVLESDFDDDDLEDLNSEIDAVEEKLEEMIEEIKE